MALPRCCGRTSAPSRRRRSAAGRCLRLQAWSGARHCGSRLEKPLVLNPVNSAMAPWVAAQKPPDGQDEPAEYAEALDRLHGVFRAGRVVLAALAKGRREE